MHGRPVTQSTSEASPSHPNRWRILAVLVLALLVTSIDHTIINVAMPQLVEGLDASAADLQWVVASYTIVFAGLLLTAGSLGDRFGRRHALAAGLATFLAGSVASALATSTTALIVGRGVMGLGGALIMPTTLSIVVNVFGDPRERAKAIAVWTAAAGLGIALGPIAGGILMRHFSWSSVFWINVPLLVAALIGTVHLIPDSRNPDTARLDPVGALLSIGAVASLVYAIIQAPADGWTSRSTLAGFAVGVTVGALFVAWELRRNEPMVDMRLFANRSFSASTVALSMLFFAMAGMVFLQAQYLQFVLDYTPLTAGFALVPAALGMLFGTGAGAHMNAALGSRIAISAGTLTAAAGVAVQAAFIDGSSYMPTGVGLLLFGLGAGIAMPAATDLIMATLPPARAGVGSAVNDTVRELGGALGVAVIGSIAATNYSASMRSELTGHTGISDPVRQALTDNVGSAIQSSGQLGANGPEIASFARTAFVDSMSVSLWVAVGLTVTATIIAVVHLPRREPAVHTHGHAAHHTVTEPDPVAVVSSAS
jgi:EmrB/QacA subfamily drug resistance transporter